MDNMDKKNELTQSADAPQITVNAQYVKDLSFENPNAPTSLMDVDKPKIDLSLDLRVSPIEKNELYEVELVISATATNEKSKLFIVELNYAGIFHLINIPEEQHKLVLSVNCPMMLFPYARKIISDATQAGGFQPMMIDPIDFGVLYEKKMKTND